MQFLALLGHGGVDFPGVVVLQERLHLFAAGLHADVVEDGLAQFLDFGVQGWFTEVVGGIDD